jgi:hypothetical protein
VGAPSKKIERETPTLKNISREKEGEKIDG